MLIKRAIQLSFLALLFAPCSTLFSSEEAEGIHRSKHSFAQTWLYQVGYNPDAKFPETRDDHWAIVNLPHTPRAASSAKIAPANTWYRKHFHLPRDAFGKIITVEFLGEAPLPEAWINGHRLIKRDYLDQNFYYDLSKYLQFGSNENVLSIRLVAPNDNNTAALSLKTKAWLEVAPSTRIDQRRIHIQAPQISATQATLSIQIPVENREDDPRSLFLLTQIIDPRGERITSSEIEIHAASQETVLQNQSFQVPSPVFSTNASPQAYAAISALQLNGRIIDQTETPFCIHADSSNGPELRLLATAPLPLP